MNVENISKGKPVGIGLLTILPGETKKLPVEYKDSPVLKMYADLGFLRLTEEGGVVKEAGTVISGAPATDAEKKSGEPTDAEKSDAADALRKARLASLNALDDAALGKLAEELGVSPADCKDTADMRKKVRAALKK